MEQDIPDYDMDSADEAWVSSQARRLNLTPLKFEEMMDRLEKSSGQTVVTVNEAKALLKQDDELSVTVYDYWLNKRLVLQHPLILAIRTENRPGAPQNNPYLAFRRRTEKMQTRKNRKNDETSYEKMLKLRLVNLPTVGRNGAELTLFVFFFYIFQTRLKSCCDTVRYGEAKGKN